jgi:hypothetical protein
MNQWKLKIPETGRRHTNELAFFQRESLKSKKLILGDNEMSGLGWENFIESVAQILSRALTDSEKGILRSD